MEPCTRFQHPVWVRRVHGHQGLGPDADLPLVATLATGSVARPDSLDHDSRTRPRR